MNMKKVTVYSVTCGDTSINFATRAKANIAVNILKMFNLLASIEVIKKDINI